jgi:hypothetical protein
VLCVLEQPREDNFSAGPKDVLCITYSVLCVLEQPREDNFSAGSNDVLCKTYSVLCVYLNSQEKIILERGAMLSRTEIIFSWLFKYTQQHTAGFTENSIGLRTEIIFSWLFKYTHNTVQVLQRTALGPALELSSLGCSSTHTTHCRFYREQHCSVLCVYLNSQEKIISVRGPMLFSVKPAVCYCMDLNSQEKIISVRGPMLFSVKPAVCCVCT